MQSYQSMVNKVIESSDILLLLLDARFVDRTRHPEMEKKIKSENKPVIYVITKCDLADKGHLESYKDTLYPCVFVSAKEHHGLKLLREAILIEAKRKKITHPIVGVLGYPNVGKSSLINALKGKQAAVASIESGLTRHVKKIKIDNHIMLLDTPGTIPANEKDAVMNGVIGAKDFNKVEDPDLVVMELMRAFPGAIEAHYGITVEFTKNAAEVPDEEARILAVAKKRNVLMKGGEYDMLKTSRMILKDWQTGKIAHGIEQL
jgi:ribosome biogenesis GTPase A